MNKGYLAESASIDNNNGISKMDKDNAICHIDAFRTWTTVILSRPFEDASSKLGSNRATRRPGEESTNFGVKNKFAVKKCDVMHCRKQIGRTDVASN